MLVRQGARVNEDELTHAVLGLLRYLPPYLWFQDFVNELRRRNPIALPALEIWSNPKVHLWPSYAIPDDWKAAFWRPKSRRGESDIPKGTICPDGLIETDRWLMFIESEYSHDLEPEQMFQQFAIAGHKRLDRHFFVLLINKALTRPSHCDVCSGKFNKPEVEIQPDNSLEEFISKSCTVSLGFPFSEEDVKKRLLWINWQSIQSMLSKLDFENIPNFHSIPDAFEGMIRRMREDVCDLLENQGLMPIDFNVSQHLSELSVYQDAIPQLPVVSPIYQFLAQLRIQSAYIPKWSTLPDISSILRITQLQHEYLPEPFSSKFGQEVPTWKTI